jgi:single-strand DNA-binding protein
MSFNKIILVGNLGRDPELRYTPQGTPVCTFSLATNERRKDAQSGEQKDLTTWFRVTLWGRQAETAAQYLQKGRPVYIEGRLRVEEYTAKEGGQRYSLEVNATDLQFIGGREGGEPQGERRVAAAASQGRPSPRTSDWDIKDGKPVRSEPPEAGSGADSADDDIPF